MTFVQATYVMATFVHISNISRQGQGKVKARLRHTDSVARLESFRVLKLTPWESSGTLRLRMATKCLLIPFGEGELE